MRTPATFLSLLAALFLAGCGQEAPVPIPTPEQKYVSVLRAAGLDQPSDALVTLGRQICSALDSGATVEQVVNVAANSSADPKEAGQVISASVYFLCPRHTEQMENYLNN